MHWETLLENAEFSVRRSGRFLVTELLVPHRVLSTSACNGGQSDNMRYLVNHQSCEGSGHHERASLLLKLGQEQYHDLVCRELGTASGLCGHHGNGGQHELRHRRPARR